MILRSNLARLLQLERSKSLEFVVRAYCMLGFFSFKITDSISLNMIAHFAEPFETKADIETFNSTILRLWMKEPDEKLSWQLFALVTQNVH